jgi:hypothetical protein
MRRALLAALVAVSAFALVERGRMKEYERRTRVWDQEMRAVNDALSPWQRLLMDRQLRRSGWPQLADWLKAVNDKSNTDKEVADSK